MSEYHLYLHKVKVYMIPVWLHLHKTLTVWRAELAPTETIGLWVDDELG